MRISIGNIRRRKRDGDGTPKSQSAVFAALSDVKEGKVEENPPITSPITRKPIFTSRAGPPKVGENTRAHLRQARALGAVRIPKAETDRL